MTPDLHDTIVALSSAPGAGLRAVVRLSGPEAVAIAAKVFTSNGDGIPRGRRFLSGNIQLPGVSSPLPAYLAVWPAPRTYTGQEMAELHTISAPPLIELLLAQLLAAGARAAQPGEFTLRAFLAGKLDLPRAEAVRAVIEAGSRDQLRDALAQFAGGVSEPLQTLRDDLLNLLADVEAALDFAEEDIQFVNRDQMLLRLSTALAQLTNLARQLDQRSLSDQPFRVVLAGAPNAGKSSLFNALAGGAALVSPEPGTTRDYLRQRLQIEDVVIELIDTAGWQDASETIGQQSQLLGKKQAEGADLVLWCVDPLAASREPTLHFSHTSALKIATKCDLAVPPPGCLATSAVTGVGLPELRDLLVERARSHAHSPLAPSLSRCRNHVTRCVAHLREAHRMVLFDDPAELLAVELRGSLDQLGEMVGAVYTDDLLDRIFSRFCIGK